MLGGSGYIEPSGPMSLHSQGHSPVTVALSGPVRNRESLSSPAPQLPASKEGLYFGSLFGPQAEHLSPLGSWGILGDERCAHHQCSYLVHSTRGNVKIQFLFLSRELSLHAREWSV